MISDIAFFRLIQLSINSKLFWCIPCLHSFIQQTSRSSQDSVPTPCTPSANLSPSPTAPTAQAPSRRPAAGYSYSQVWSGWRYRWKYLPYGFQVYPLLWMYIWMCFLPSKLKYNHSKDKKHHGWKDLSI